MTSKALQKPANKASEIRALFERNKQQIAMALPRHLTPDRMLRIVLTAVNQTPQLLDADQRSLFAAVIKASTLGLEPDGNLGQAYLVPYQNRKRGVLEVQFIPGYRGLITLARNSGELTAIEARAVFAGDRFKYRYGLNPILDHEPADESYAELTHVYAIAYLRGGGPPQWDVMRKFEVDRVRDGSRAKDSGPWVTHYTEMAKKTVLKRLAKLLPLSAEARQAIDLDDKAEIGQSQDIVIPGVTDEEPTGSKLDALTRELSGGDAVDSGQPIREFDGVADKDRKPTNPPGDLLGPES